MDKEMELPFRNYVEFFRQGLLIKEIKVERSENPKISIIIPMYNEAKNAKLVIRSIQNQSFQDFEIVCVNDNSNDDTLEVLEKLQEEDPRITILTNKSNRGVLYNRIYGALKSKGEYVTFLDADDGFANINILKKSYDMATKEKGEKIDMIHYQTCGCVIDENGKLGNFLLLTIFNPKSFEKVLRQPEISDNYFQKSNNITGSGFVFDKIYSKELMKRVANYIGPQIWNQNLVFSDDFLLAYAAMRMANTLVNLGEIGYFHNSLCTKLLAFKIIANGNLVRHFIQLQNRNNFEQFVRRNMVNHCPVAQSHYFQFFLVHNDDDFFTKIQENF